MSRDSIYKHREDYQNCWYKDFCDKFLNNECHSTCNKFSQTDYMFQLSNLPKSMWRAIRLDDTKLNPETAEILNTIVADINYFVVHGYNLFLYGLPGTGKTSWAIKLMNNFFASVAEKNGFRTRGLFISVPSFLRDAKLRITYKDDDYLEFLKDIQRCDIVIWDELEQTSPTSFESQWLYSFINERILAGKCNIFTSNKTPDELGVSDPLMKSRVCNSSDCLEITGPDRRKYNKYSYHMSAWEEQEDGSDTSIE